MNHRSTWAALPLLAVLIIIVLAIPSHVLASDGQWTWMSGANMIWQAGVYGAQGTPAPGNLPGARERSISWIDSAGNLWLFGGYGRDSAGSWGNLNDLWRYDANREWTWMSGANTRSQAGAYGIQGTPAAGNVPGARYGSIAWIDRADSLWLFGGHGRDSAGNWGWLNDLWRYDANGEWTWMSGANTVGLPGVYGTQGTPAPGNVPGARLRSISWIDGAGDLWLFGGLGRDSLGGPGGLNDLWRCSRQVPSAVTLVGLETGSQVGSGWGWLLAIAASGLALAGTLASRRKGQFRQRMVADFAIGRALVGPGHWRNQAA